jgi:ATP-dependent DNA helicase RecQ
MHLFFYFQHFISRFCVIFIENITQLSKELNLALDNSTASTAVEDVVSALKPVLKNNLPGNLADVRSTSWELWQKHNYSFLKVAVSYCYFDFNLHLILF